MVIEKHKNIITKTKLIKELVLYFPKKDNDYLYGDFYKLTNYTLDKMLKLFEGKLC